MKKQIIFLSIFLLFSPYFVFADDIDDEDFTYEEVSSPISKEPEIYSKSGIVFDRTTKTVLYEKDIHSKRAMASTTKIMTSILILENCNLSDTITVSQKSANTGGSRLGLHTNDKVTVHDLLYGLMLVSGNDAAVALSEYLAGSVEEFSVLMNNKAHSLGLINTNFVTPHGLDNENHYTTAYELALLTDYALNNELFSKIVNTKSYTITINGYSKNLSNTNELLGYTTGVNGVKTGFTGNAGRCLVSSCCRNNFDIIIIVLGADTKKIRTTDSIKLIEYTYDNFELLNVQELVQKDFNEWCSQNLKNIHVNKSNSPILVYLDENVNYTIAIEKSINNNLHTEIHSISYLESPTYKNEKIGVLTVKNGDSILFTIDILLSQDIIKKSVFDYFLEFILIYV